MEKRNRDFAQGEAAVAVRMSSNVTGEWTPMLDWSTVFPGNRGIGKKKQYDLYDAPRGIQLKIEEALKSEPLLVAQDGWEGNGSLTVFKVWQDNGRYHMLYMAARGRTSHEMGMANAFGGTPEEEERAPGGMGYAYSDDAYNWIRPSLGQAEFNGSRDNNKIANGPTGAPFEDPLGRPEERYKAMGQEGGNFDPETGEQLTSLETARRFGAMAALGDAYEGPGMISRHWISGWTSPDLLHWTKLDRPVSDSPSDGGTAASFDPETGTYFAYIRVGGNGRRAIGLTVTDDFWTWPQAKLCLAPDSQDQPDESFYGCNYFPYPGSKDLHGMFVQIYHQIADTVDNQIAFSRDKMKWDRPERKPIIPLGPVGSGEDCIVYCWAGGGLIELPDGYWATPYRGISWLHNSMGIMPQRAGQIRWARWKPHRLCGIEADTEGSFTIPTVTVARKELRLNYRCKPGGWISVELISGIPSRLHPEMDGAPGFTHAECIRLTGDSLSETVRWAEGSDISAVGASAAIRITMFGAKIFAYSI